MSTKLTYLISFVLVLSLVCVSSGVEGLLGQYYHTSGGGPPANPWQTLVLERIDPTVNFNWGDPGSPDPSVNVNNFAARWIFFNDTATTEIYTFHTQTDDGIRLWVDNKLIIENWTDHGNTHDAGNIALQAGQKYDIKLEWYENGGGARCELNWETPTMARAPIPSQYLSADRPFARDPAPADGTLMTSFAGMGTSLVWTAGDTAASHDVYFGTNYAEVKAGTGGTFRGNQTATHFLVGYGYTPNDPVPNGLVWGTTYYWRIDEVEADEVTKYTGDVWSFSLPPTTAYKPTPSDEGQFIDTNVDLSWEAGIGMTMQTVYFGDDYDTVSNATTGGTPGAGAITYDPGQLELEKHYFWRVDTAGVFGQIKGDVWSFKTQPYIPITDPALIGWWKLDGVGSGTTAVDWSGYNHHGTIMGDPEWVIGYDGDALELDGDGDYVDIGSVGIKGMDPRTIAGWVKASTTAVPSWTSVFGFAHDGSGDGTYFDIEVDDAGHYGVYIYGWGAIICDVDTRWHHFAATYNGSSGSWYLDGQLVDSLAGPIATIDEVRIGARLSYPNFFPGLVDDVRIYNKALTLNEIREIMKGDPDLAWDPHPANGSMADVIKALPLSWSPGEKAAQHDVYFGTDKDAVADADTSTTGIYRDRRSNTSYTPPEGVEWGSGPYYWRIDEYNIDATISKGRVWSFTVADYLIVDDFEAYKGGDAPLEENIWYAWRDGVGFGTAGIPPYSAGNGTGSVVGDLTTSSYTEETIVHGGRQSMPYWYNNNLFNPFKMKYTEAKLTLSAPRDWTEENVKALSLWFQGYPGSVGSFTDNLNGTYTMTGSGTDIEGSSDQFHFAYKTLVGAGTIVARVDSVQETHDWSKAGVMIRETLDPNSAHAFACITPAQGVASQSRNSMGGDYLNVNQGGITAPHWVRLERDMAGNFTVSHSTNGSAWVAVEGASPQTIRMNATVYVGLALTSHDAALTCEATFSNVTITGTVAGQWTSQDIGIMSNDAEPMYVAIANNTGQPAVVYHDDQNAAQIDTWTEWNIDLADFTGINLTDVNSIAIGFGDRNNPQAGGSGKMYFDDISLYRSRCVPEEVTLSQADLNGDCIVDFRDLEIMAGDWLKSSPDFSADLNVDSMVDFKDYAVLADEWLNKQLWP
jgi:hypothetical protein